MAQTFNEWLQSRLNVHGANLRVDGMIGGETQKALRVFQGSKMLKITGTASAATVTALRRDAAGKDSGPAKVVVLPPWHAELLRRKGLHEVRDYSALAKWLKLDGRTLGDPRKLPWCGDAIDTVIGLALPGEPRLANPYLARNWMKFGKSTRPRLGAIMVFWRGSLTGTSGHVALYVSEDATHYTVLGGNQANAITLTRIAKSRFLGARWPSTFDLDTEAVTEAANQATPISHNEA